MYLSSIVLPKVSLFWPACRCLLITPVPASPHTTCTVMCAWPLYPLCVSLSPTLPHPQLTNVRKFLQKVHSGPPGRDGGKLYLLPDLSAECEDLLWQVSDDPFEVKLRANYEVCVCVFSRGGGMPCASCVYTYHHISVDYGVCVYMCVCVVSD